MQAPKKVKIKQQREKQRKQVNPEVEGGPNLENDRRTGRRWQETGHFSAEIRKSYLVFSCVTHPTPSLPVLVEEDVS